MNPLTLLELLDQPEFQRGFAAGVVALVAVLLIRKAGWLLAWGLAAVAGLAWSGLLRSNPMVPEWGLPAVAVTALAAAASFYALMRKMPAWAAGIAFALWVLGVWGTVPDTERATVVMGVTVAMVPVLWPGLRIRSGWEGMAVAAAVLGFVVITDGAARTTSIVGALGMVGMPVAAAASSWLRPHARPSPLWLVAAQAVHVIVCGRVAGQMLQPKGALIVVILSALVTGAGTVLGVKLVRPGP